MCKAARIVSLLLCTALLQAGLTARGEAQDRGASALSETLAGLSTSARVLMVGAHPDDEDTWLLAFLARGRHVESAYLSLTRGDGGQNRIGNELGEALGVIRTEELLAARRIDGAHQFFTHAYDFGFSKNAEETFKHWARDSILRDMITVVRAFRPHIIVAVFGGTRADGHGHHEVSGLLAREVFDAAADSVKYPASISGGLPAWNTLKLYRTQRTSGNGATVGYNVGEYSPVIGRSFGEIAGESRSQHKSQGFGSLEPRGTRLGYLRLERSRVGAVVATENSMFDGIDTTWNRFRSVPSARNAIDSLTGALRDARALYNPFEPGRVISALGRAKAALRRLCIRTSDAFPQCDIAFDGVSRFADLETSRRETTARVDHAIRLASGISVEANVAREVLALGSGPQIDIVIHNRGRTPVTILDRQVAFGTALTMQMAGATHVVAPDSTVSLEMSTREMRGETGPWWLETPRNGAMFPPPPLVGTNAASMFRGAIAEDRRAATGTAMVTLRIEGTEARFVVPVTHRFADPVLGEMERPATLAPAIVVMLDRDVEFAKAGATYDRTVAVRITSAAADSRDVAVSLQLPRGLSADSASRTLSLAAGATKTVTFRVRGHLTAGRYSIGAVAASGEEKFTSGYTLIDYPHIRRQRVYRAATITTRAVGVVIPPRLRVAYIPGVGDNVAPILAQMGVNVTVVPVDAAAATDFSGFTTVVVGPRAYDANPQLIAANERLFAFVRRGGTMVVQYSQNIGRPGVMPFPVAQSGGQDRVTEEDAVVRLLDPAAPLLNLPNKIGAADFEGWVQERALYMMTRTRDSAYKPLVSMNDTGEAPLDGGLLVARLGSGTYVYCALALFRQIPAGVPGAARIMVNLMAGGRG